MSGLLLEKVGKAFGQVKAVNDVDLQLRFDVESMVTRRGSTSAAPGATGLDTLSNTLDFFQLRGTYSVTGRAGDRKVSFTAPGSAETFRGK